MMYKLLVFNSPRELSNEVTEYLKEGWKLYGSPVTSSYVNDGVSWAEYGQAMTYVGGSDG